MNNHVFLLPVALILGIMIRISGDNYPWWYYLLLTSTVYLGWQIASFLHLELPHAY